MFGGRIIRSDVRDALEVVATTNPVLGLVSRFIGKVSFLKFQAVAIG